LPVLVVPGDAKAFDVTAPVMVAWNGSAEAAHALRAAVPLLAAAGKVWLVSIAEASDKKPRFDFPALEGAQYLSRHGIACEVVEVPRGEAKIGDTLFSAAQMRGCGLMVMGAYGHSRLAEMLLGGVTRQMLSEPQRPVLLAHYPRHCEEPEATRQSMTGPWHPIAMLVDGLLRLRLAMTIIQDKA
jgi:nucleotide-binding universal stress UspA family protein